MKSLPAGRSHLRYANENTVAELAVKIDQKENGVPGKGSKTVQFEIYQTGVINKGNRHEDAGDFSEDERGMEGQRVRALP